MTHRLRHGIKIFLALLTLIACITTAQAAVSIKPIVQFLDIKDGSPITVDSSWVIVIADLNDSPAYSSATYLQQRLETEFGLTLSIQDLNGPMPAGRRIVLGLGGNTTLDLLANAKGIALGSDLGEEGYVLDVSATPDIVIMANAAKGVFRGLQSLLREDPLTGAACQTLCDIGGILQIDQLQIRDWPDGQLRGSYFENDQEFARLYDSHLEELARWKMNFIAAGSRAPAYSRYPANKGPVEMVAKAHGYHLFTAPLLRGMNGGLYLFGEYEPPGDTETPREYPSIAEATWMKDEAFTFTAQGSDWEATPVIDVSMPGAIPNADFEMTVPETGVWSINGENIGTITQAAGEGRNGSTAMKFSKAIAEANPNGPWGLALNLHANSYIPVEGGKTYSLSFWARTQDMVGRLFVAMGQYAADRSSRVYGTSESMNLAEGDEGTRTWRKFYLNIHTAPDTAYLSLYMRMDKKASGTTWVDDLELRRMNGALVNVLDPDTGGLRVRKVTAGTEELCTKDGDYSVEPGIMSYLTYVCYPDNIPYGQPGCLSRQDPDGDGPAYVLSHRFFVYAPPTKIKLLLTGNTAPRTCDLQSTDTILVDYDSVLWVEQNSTKSVKHPHSIMDERTYTKKVFPYIDEMLAIYGTDYAYYTGLTETRGLNRDSRNHDETGRRLENYEVAAYNLNKVFNYIKNKDASAKLLTLDDMFNPWHNGSDETYQSRLGAPLGALEPCGAADCSTVDWDEIDSNDTARVSALFPDNTQYRSDIIMSIWYGSNEPDKIDRVNKAPAYYASRGYSWVGTPKLDAEVVEIWANRIQGTDSLGMINYGSNTNTIGVKPTANFAWNYDQKTDYTAAHWIEDGGNGSVVEDTTRFTHDGMLGGGDHAPAWVLGRALAFDGNDYVAISNPPDLNPQRDVTISAWIFIDNLPTEKGTVLYRRLSNTSRIAYSMQVKTDGNMTMRVDDGVNPGINLAGPGITLGNWTHVSCVLSLADSQVRWYINGVRKTSAALAVNAFVAADDVAYIGATSNNPLDSTAQRFVGKLRGVQLVSGSLADAQIAVLANDQPDLDNDGLSDNSEIALGTDTLQADSDGDGLTDGDEFHVHSTNPLQPDTDMDGYNDGYEVYRASLPGNPLSMPTSADGDLNQDRQVTVIDAMLASRIALGTLPPTAAQQFLGDVAPLGTGDDAINAADFLLITRKALGESLGF